MTEDGVRYQDGELKLRDGRTLAWRWWGEPDGIPVLRLQGTPGCRLYRHPDPAVQRDLGVRYLLADRPGYGGSTRLPGRGRSRTGHGHERRRSSRTGSGGEAPGSSQRRHRDRGFVPARA